VATVIGIVIDPDGLRNQIEGGFVWGMSAAVKSDITFSAGTVDQSNYFDYEVMRMGELPRWKFM
jgi:isoquinoline 1-oxidoreductase subunit beta